MDYLQFDEAERLLWLRRGADTEPERERRWQLYELGARTEPIPLHQQTETNWVPYWTAFAPGGERFFIGSQDKLGRKPLICVFDVASGRELWRTNAWDCVVSEVHVDPTGNWFIYKTNERNHWQIVRMSDFKKFGRLQDFCDAIGPTGDIFAKAKYPDGHIVFSRDGSAAGLPLVSDWETSFTPIFSPDGKLFAWGTVGSAVLVADLATVRQQLEKLQRSAR